MTLGRLMYLYQAEQQGKQIMVREYYYSIYGSHERITEVKLSECELSSFMSNDMNGYSYTYFIKDEEDEWSNKLSKLNLQ